MSRTNRILRVAVVVMAVTVAGWVPAMAGSGAIGSLAGSRNATLSGEAAMANTTVFSGDSLRVREGVAVVALGQGSRMVFGRETEASFLKEGNGVTVLLGRGNVSVYEPASSSALKVKAGEVAVEPVAGYKTLGEVAMVDGAVTVTAKEGMMKVEGQGAVKEVAAGKTLTLAAKTARAPMPAPGGISDAHITTTTGLEVGSLAAAVAAALEAAVATARADDARNSANQANSTAAAAESAAIAAAASAAAATSAANLAASNANAVGCALNTVANHNGEASPYTPPSGYSCP